MLVDSLGFDYARVISNQIGVPLMAREFFKHANFDFNR